MNTWRYAWDRVIFAPDVRFHRNHYLVYGSTYTVIQWCHISNTNMEYNSTQSTDQLYVYTPDAKEQKFGLFGAQDEISSMNTSWLWLQVFAFDYFNGPGKYHLPNR